jgi:hypothetical protein
MNPVLRCDEIIQEQSPDEGSCNRQSGKEEFQLVETWAYRGASIISKSPAMAKSIITKM